MSARVAALLVAAALAAAPGARAADLADFAGEWVRAEPERDDAARHAEIERVTEPMSAVFRPLARAVMRRRTRPSERFAIVADGGQVSIRMDDGVAYPIDGKAHPGDEGHAVTTRLRDDGVIHMSWTHGESSHGTTDWRLLDAGARLLVVDCVLDSHFEGAMEFSNVYRRIGAAR